MSVYVSQRGESQVAFLETARKLSAHVNGIIICRKMAKKNVVFPTYFLYPKFYDIMYTYIIS